MRKKHYLCKMRETKLLFLLFFIWFPFVLVAENYRSEILKSVHYFEIKGSKLIRTDSIIIQINGRAGDVDAEIGLPYSKGDKVDVLYAQIEDMRGNVIRKLKKNEIKDRSYISNMSLYEDDFIKTFELRHNVYPYKVSYAVTTTLSKFFQIASINPQWTRVPIRDGKIVVEAPEDYPIKYKQKNTKELIVKNGKTVQYSWQFSFTPLQYREVNACNNEDAPKITIVPLNFKYGKEEGSWDTWKTFGNWIARLNKDRDVLPASEKQKISRLLFNANNDKEKVKILYHYLQQNTRYVNVKIDAGGFQTYPASYVCTNRYGDCKALSNYLQALLKYADIPSYYTLVYMNDRVKDIDVDFPSQEFNHVILTVPLGNDTIFLECTDKNGAFGYVHTGIQGRKALLISNNNSHIITIPAMTPDDVLCSRKITVNGNSVSLQTSQRGGNYEVFKYLNTNINKSIVDLYLRNTVFPTGIYTLQEYEIQHNENRDIAQIDFKADLNMERIIKSYDKDLVLTQFSMSMPVYENPEKRTEGVQIDFPTYQKDTVVYYLQTPISELPENIFIDTPFGHYAVDFGKENNNLIVRKSILILAGRYKHSDYNDFYNFIATIYKHEHTNLYLKTK